MQGTILGPLLFNLFINEFFLNFKNNEKIHLTGLADDISVAIAIANIHTLKEADVDEE